MCCIMSESSMNESRSGPSSVIVMSPMSIQSDNPSVQITIVKLDGTNYLERSPLARMYDADIMTEMIIGPCTQLFYYFFYFLFVNCVSCKGGTQF